MSLFLPETEDPGSDDPRPNPRSYDDPYSLLEFIRNITAVAGSDDNTGSILDPNGNSDFASNSNANTDSIRGSNLDYNSNPVRDGMVLCEPNYLLILQFY